MTAVGRGASCSAPDSAMSGVAVLDPLGPLPSPEDSRVTGWPRMDTDADRYRRNLRSEVDGAALYRVLATAEASAELAEVYRRLASVEDRHAELWRIKLREAGHEPPSIAPGVRVSFLGWMARQFG